LTNMWWSPTLDRCCSSEGFGLAIGVPGQEFLAVTTFYYQPSGIAAFALVTTARVFMFIVRYIAWVGASLIALLFVANWYLPKSSPEPAPEASNRPNIRIASMQQPPERVVIDTSLPTLGPPPPTLFGDAVPDHPSPVLESYASLTSPATAVNLDRKKRKVVTRQEPKVAPHQPALARTPAVASSNSVATLQLARLSFADIISGRLVRTLFDLH
jgi:hypothetical protein